jgi:hypothetical protein
MRVGVPVIHGRAYHPETQGKLERFHRTVGVEVLDGGCRSVAEWQERLDEFREVYNRWRPHEALGDDVPASRYEVSPREYPERFEPVEYDSGFVRKVDARGYLYFGGREFKLSKAFRGERVALRETETDGCYDVVYCAFRVAHVDMRTTRPTVTHVSERV